METLLSKRAAFPRPCAQNFRNNKCTPAPLILLSSACFRGPTSSRKLILHSHSRSPAGGGHCNEGCQISLPWPERTQGPRCRAYKDGSNNEAGAVDENTVLKVIRALGAFVNANFLIVALSSSVIFGLAWPYPGRAAQKMGLTKLCTCAIFLLSGMNIRSGDAEQGIAAWPAGLFGLISILLITPLVAIPILAMQSSPRELVGLRVSQRRVLPVSYPFKVAPHRQVFSILHAIYVFMWPVAYAGLAIFSCAPTTLSSAVCLTQIAGANTTLAIGMTVFSNLFSVVTMPFTLTTVVGKGIGVSIPPGQLLQSLLQTLLVPLVLGKIIRETFSDVAKLVDGNRRQVAMLTASFQSMVPWMQISTSRAMLLQIEPSNLLLISAAGLVLHIVYLATNFLLMKFLPWHSLRDDYNSRAVLLVTSQKSIVVSIAVIDRLGGAFGNAGVLVLPCIAAQFSQVITDSILVNGWVQNDEGVEKSLMSCML